MSINQSTYKLMIRLWNHISRHRRGQFGLLLVLMVLTSFAEVVSIGAVLPFLGVLISPERIYNNPLAYSYIQKFGLTEPNQLLLPLTITFGLAAIFSGSMRILLLWTSTRLSFATGADLSISIYRRTLYQPYAVHCARNSSEIINGISTKVNLTIGVINSILVIFSSTFLLMGILIALISVDPLIAIAAFGGFGIMYAIIIKLTHERLLKNSVINARESTNMIRSLQEGLSGIRDVLIDGSQEAYCQIYTNADWSYRRTQSILNLIGTCPRFIMEVIGMLLISFLAYMLAKQPDGIAKAIPVLGAIALGAQRLLPVLQQTYNSLTIIKGNQVSLQDTLDLLDQPMPKNISNLTTEFMPFKFSIELKNIDFQYNSNLPLVLRKIDLNIGKGKRIGFIGATGSGKSTLLDIIMGLLQPSAGTLEIDGIAIDASNQRAWQAHIAHVPQTIFLADSSIEENIAFGIPKASINTERVKEVAKQAQIAEYIETLPNQYETNVGERGIRLSGGQRQRIGIARALYKKADVIIFDEATSALDNETEQAVMQAIENLSKDLTLLIIAHRLSTLKNCTMIVELSEGGVKQTGTYEQLMGGPQIGQNIFKQVFG